MVSESRTAVGLTASCSRMAHFRSTDGLQKRGDVLAAPVGEDYRDVNFDREYSSGAHFVEADRAAEHRALPSVPACSNRRTDADRQSIRAPTRTISLTTLAEPFEDRIDLGRLNVQYHFGFADLTSTTSYWNRDDNLRQDGTEEIATVLGRAFLPRAMAAPAPPPPRPSKTIGRISGARRSASPPRATRPSSGWLATSIRISVVHGICTSSPRIRPFRGLSPMRSLRFSRRRFCKIRRSAKLSYTLFDQLTATAGARRYYYKGTVNTAVSGWLSSSGSTFRRLLQTEERDQGVTPKFNLSYQLDKEMLLYTTVAQGFRPGGGNQPIPTSGALGTQCLANLQASA